MDLSNEWRDLLLMLPGYDPFRSTGGAWFDPDVAQLYLDFFPECLTHVEGPLAGQPFHLERWQKSWVANLFGWRRKDELGRVVRRYKQTLLYVARKNGKTPLVAGICLAEISINQEKGQQNYLAAESRKTGRKLLRHAKIMVTNEPQLDSRFTIYGGESPDAPGGSIVRDRDKSFIQVISADAQGEHGGNTSMAAVDELHTQPNRGLIDVIQTSMSSLNRTNQLLVMLTTADYMQESICNEKYEYACKVRDNSQNPDVGLNDPQFLPAIYELRPEDDWRDPKNWPKANPNLGVSKSVEYMEGECKHATETPAFENTFRRLDCNQRTEQDQRAIAADAWKRCAHGVTPAEAQAWRERTIKELAGQTCYGGLDLGSTNDLTALALYFPSVKTALLWYWATKEAIERRRKQRVPFDAWARQGFITATDGSVTDYDVVRADMNALAQQFGIRELAVDRVFQGAQLCTQLMGDGFNVIAFGQGFYSMAAPVKRILDLIAAAELVHGADPVLNWMAGNVSTEQDAAGCLKFSKKKSGDKIDGMVALTMAVGRADCSTGDDGIPRVFG